MAAAYLAQEAFKEPTLALFLLAFALLLPRRGGARGDPARSAGRRGDLRLQVPRARLARGDGGRSGLIELRLARARAHGDRWRWRRAREWAVLALGGARCARDPPPASTSRDFRALDPDKANEGGLGNLRGHLSPLKAFGIWPTSEFRLPAGAGSLPAAVFYAGGLVGLARLRPRPAALDPPPRRRRSPPRSSPRSLLYLAARGFGTVYTSAKALAIARPADHADHPRRPARERDERPARQQLVLAALGVAVALAAAVSSFLILRQAPVAPEDHRTSWRSSGRWWRARSCCSSAATTSSSTSCGARGRSPQ